MDPLNTLKIPDFAEVKSWLAFVFTVPIDPFAFVDTKAVGFVRNAVIESEPCCTPYTVIESRATIVLALSVAFEGASCTSTLISFAVPEAGRPISLPPSKLYVNGPATVLGKPEEKAVEGNLKFVF